MSTERIANTPLQNQSGVQVVVGVLSSKRGNAHDGARSARANAIKLNGIDDWVLGVHLDSKQGTVWHRKDGALVADEQFVMNLRIYSPP